MKVLHRILMGTDVVKNVNKNNAAHAVLFEALALVKAIMMFLVIHGMLVWISICKPCYYFQGNAFGCGQGDDVTMCCYSWKVHSCS